ncbi:hypothetical protein D6D15_02504 [Aureobasidium pullulans]|uniref:SnoaL-like domain-containing protein n=3 Tax=Aureobasidium pullulans TaxID=5580 RepID=A0A4S9BJK1_AURPU|nr:hypothetical protein D6D15_02504 [Aureobasidium pullulans]
MYCQLKATRATKRAPSFLSVSPLSRKPNQMRPFTPRYIQQTANILSRPASLQFARTQPLNQTQTAAMSSGLNIENTNIKTAPGVSLEGDQKTLVGSVLDLFAGRPSLEKLQLWKDDGVFEDPITIAQGRKQYEAQWYGLQSAFSEIERLSHEVTSSGNPISMNMKTRYVVKGIGKEQTISSVVNIFHEGGKITKVEDKWDGKLPDGAIANAFRNLNSVTVPKIISVPKNKEEDAARGN